MKSLLSCRLNGGLGNQMFQIATTYAMALDNYVECAFDFSMTPVYQGNSPETYRKSVFKKLNELPVGWKPEHIYKEKSYVYTPIPYKPNMLMEGYLGHEKYFSHRKREILALFKDEMIVNRIRHMYSGMLDNSVSIHVRRGDYLKFPDVYILLSPEYYYHAIKLLDEKAEIDHILVFSDDIPWCRKNLKDKRMIFITNKPDYIDLYMMSLCDHNILANSSFSWWGTYLNENEGKIVYAPKKWFKDGCEANAESLFCNNWIKI